MVPTFGQGSSVQGGAGGSAGPSTGRSEGIFDQSGWSVIFGDGNRLDSTRADTGNLGQYLPWILAGVGLLIVARMARK